MKVGLELGVGIVRIGLMYKLRPERILEDLNQFGPRQLNW